MILQMPVDKSSPEVGSNLSWQQQTLLGGTQQQITELCNGVPPYVVKNEETDMCILVLTFLLLWLPLPTQIIMFLSARFGPGKILEDICTIVGSAQKILLNLIESYWFKKF